MVISQPTSHDSQHSLKVPPGVATGSELIKGILIWLLLHTNSQLPCRSGVAKPGPEPGCQHPHN